MITAKGVTFIDVGLVFLEKKWLSFFAALPGWLFIILPSIEFASLWLFFKWKLIILFYAFSFDIENPFFYWETATTLEIHFFIISKKTLLYLLKRSFRQSLDLNGNTQTKLFAHLNKKWISDFRSSLPFSIINDPVVKTCRLRFRSLSANYLSLYSRACIHSQYTHTQCDLK